MKKCPRFSLALVKKDDDFVLELFHYIESHKKNWPVARIGKLIKQPDGEFDFEYTDRETRKMVSEVIQSDDVQEAYFGFYERRRK
jgi:hypothetical protein